MNIVVIGSGNVGSHLSRLFAAAGHQIRQVWSRDVRHASDVAEAVGAVPLCRFADIDRTADIYIIAVPDDHIAGVSLQLPVLDGIVVHTSGSTDISALCQRRRGVMWFLHSFVKDVPMDCKPLHCCYEGSSSDVDETIKNLLCEVAIAYRLDGEQRRWAHLASVLTNNFGNALNALAEQICMTQGIDFAMLQPLIASTAASAAAGGIVARQTGPAARHDQKTIDTQLSMLAGIPAAQRVYEAMTELIQSFQKSSAN